MGVLRRLTESECRAHLARNRTGRIAVVAPDGPHIIPVNYTVVDEQVVFRTSRTTLLARYAPGSTIAFEVEDTDAASKSAWSVVARGPAEVVDDPAQRDHIRKIWQPEPWADGERDLYLRLLVRELSGRSVGAPFPDHGRADGPRGWGRPGGDQGPFDPDR